MRTISTSKKSLKLLIRQFSQAVSEGQTGAKAKLLLEEIRFIISQLRFRLTRRELRRIVGGISLIAGLSFSQQAQGQASYIAPVTNPFGLTGAYQLAYPVEADMDNDGDLDLLVAEYYGNFQYYQNTGTATAPSFALPNQNPFNLTAVASNYPKFSLVDLDNDGDLDLMAAETTFNYATYSLSTDIKYFQNVGTSSVPNFAAPITNPFGITAGTYLKIPELVDLDNDGDYDLLTVEYNSATSSSDFKYYQNIGSATTPVFGASINNPFGMSVPTGSPVPIVNFDDLDGDGDYDMLIGDYYSTGNFRYAQNNGSSSVPSFGAQITNPFGLTPTNQGSTYGLLNAPIFLDLDNDGDLDILSGEYGGDLRYFQNTFISTGPLAFGNIVINTPSCSPGGDGSITAVATGGVGTITYKILNDSNSNGQFVNYSTGTYTIRIKDSANTIVDSVITMGTSVPPIYDSNNSFSQNVSCNGLADGFILISTTGGVAPINYTLNPGNLTNTTGTFTPLAANTYTVTFTDSKNCVGSTTLSISSPPPLLLNLNSTTNINCFGGNNGTINVSGSGGNGGLSYTIIPTVGTQTSPGVFTNLTAGNYAITCTDINGCSATIQQTITQPTSATVIALSNVTNVSCFGGNNGTFMATATGGPSPFTYSCSPVVGSQSTPGVFSSLTANTYTVTATDANGCLTTNIQTITQPPQLVLNIANIQNASSSTATNGSITSNASGGVTPYVYSIAPNTGTQSPAGTFSNLSAGNYTITITDANNCNTTKIANVGDAWSVGVDDIEKNNVAIYPNPFSDLIKLESDTKIMSLTILDITGKIIETIEQPQETVSLGKLPNGLYILRITLENERTVHTRITKQ